MGSGFSIAQPTTQKNSDGLVINTNDATNYARSPGFGRPTSRCLYSWPASDTDEPDGGNSVTNVPSQVSVVWDVSAKSWAGFRAAESADPESSCGGCDFQPLSTVTLSRGIIGLLISYTWPDVTTTPPPVDNSIFLRSTHGNVLWIDIWPSDSSNLESLVNQFLVKHPTF
jgi:hypothetical protein